MAVPELWKEICFPGQRKKDNELFKSGSQPFSPELHEGPVLSVLWALERAAMVAVDCGPCPSFFRRELCLSKVVGEILQEKVAIVEM